MYFVLNIILFIIIMALGRQAELLLFIFLTLLLLLLLIVSLCNSMRVLKSPTITPSGTVLVKRTVRSREIRDVDKIARF